MTQDKGWIKIKNRANKEYIDGCDKFLEWAFGRPGTRKRIRCPCNRCRNTEFYSRTEVRYHLFDKGFYERYTCWTLHGEERKEATKSDGENTQNECRDEFNELIQDVCSHIDTNITDTTGLTSVDSPELHEEPNSEATKFYNLIEDAKQKLYEGCDDELTKLSYIVKLLHQKCLNKWTDKICGCVAEIPEENLTQRCLGSRFLLRCQKNTKQLGLDYTKIDACLNDYILYWKEHANAKVCPTCGESRWKTVVDRDNNLRKTHKRHKKIPHKVLRYFPITPRLQRLYMSRKTAKDIRWNKEENIDRGLMKHPTDSLAWKSFDESYPTFASDPRSVRLGLASDRFNPFGNMSTSYSVWPVILVPYNFPPWLCIKQPYFMMALLIPGINSPGNDIDVYFQPLIEELKNLWEVGVEAYDAYSHQNFNLRAAVIWTINDFLAYGNLSGWVTKGKLAYPYFHAETSYHSLRNKGVIWDIEDFYQLIIDGEMKPQLLMGLKNTDVTQNY